ncbi:transcription initiation factor IIA large subunit [Diplogelasinospora grovesii]|uniref:Transcription initiation factor IIA large subunit n=1 Tax=Diplogelasinospora grovesii TaxID=303347 RepID=A0AAN6NGE1_9PEZI|nr:transcription initiation factor IIA large subunit [Diplogelasinospora grovesii]
MSNAAVGAVYEHIINEVISAVRIDFEEAGVDEAALDELKKNWQRKLSALNIAQFPWDPKPEAANVVQQHAPVAIPNTPQNVAAPPQQHASYTQATLSPPQHHQQTPQPLTLPGGNVQQQQQGTNGVHIKTEPGVPQQPKQDPPQPIIKQEPGTAPQNPNAHPAYPGPARGMAAQRAAQALESQYGARAAASISAIHHGMGSQMNNNPAGQPVQPHQQQQQQMYHQQQGQHAQRPPQQGQQQIPQQQLNAQQQYRQGVAAQMMQQRMQQQQHQHQQQANGGQNALHAAQTDGPTDDSAFDAVLMQRGPDGKPVNMGRVEIDNILHSQLAARAKQMEGGGLMLPLKEATKTRNLPSKRPKETGASQVDGPDDDDLKDEEVDEDAINSDLDDPEDENIVDEDDDELPHMMLCMYDKVQRVKNKWKCTLKDGVLTVNGREYVFHKATGEYEW